MRSEQTESQKGGSRFWLFAFFSVNFGSLDPGIVYALKYIENTLEAWYSISTMSWLFQKCVREVACVSGRKRFHTWNLLGFPISYLFYMENLDFSVTKDFQIFYSLLYFKAERRKRRRKDNIFLNWVLWISCVFTLTYVVDWKHVNFSDA